jgi:hypothetical protein
MTAKSSDASQRTALERPREHSNLDCRYGEIGIMAVAAAARYTGDGKSQAEPPVAPRIEQRFMEVSA